MKLQQLMSYTRRAIDDYNMIQDGDRIGYRYIGRKGQFNAFIRTPWTTTLLSEKIRSGGNYGRSGASWFWCVRHSLPVRNHESSLYRGKNRNSPDRVWWKERKESMLPVRKNAQRCFKRHDKKLGCNKIAYAHHKDDIVETNDDVSDLTKGHFISFPSDHPSWPHRPYGDPPTDVCFWSRCERLL